MLMLCVPSVFSFLVFRDFKGVAVQFIGKIDNVVQEIGELRDEVKSLKENFIRHQVSVDNRMDFLQSKRGGR